MSQLLPERTPEWLKPALGVDPSQVQELIGNRQASSLNGTNVQVPVKREAAVLMLLSGESAEEASILLTHRSPSMRSHSGQIAFPGGRRDPADTSLVDTALREAWEETDLQRNSVTPGSRSCAAGPFPPRLPAARYPPGKYPRDPGGRRERQSGPSASAWTASDA